MHFIAEVAQYAGIYLDALMELFAFFNAFLPSASLSCAWD